MFSRIFDRRPNPGIPRVFEGEVIRADTCQPVAGTRVNISTERETSHSWFDSTGLTDAAGRFKITSLPGKSFILTAFPLDREPYLIVQKKIELADGGSPPKIEFVLPRGVLVHGKIIETASEKPVDGASIQFVVHLSPCGKAIARFVDPEGKPLVKYEPHLHIVVSPGPCYGNEKQTTTELVADQDFIANFDREHYNRNSLATDKQGYCTFPALIPGATYRLPMFRKPSEWEEIDFFVKPFETLQLPDIVVSQEEIDALATQHR